MTKTWEEMEKEMDAYMQTKRFKFDQFVYRLRRFVSSPLRWPRNIKHIYQRARRGYADYDMWNFDGYAAELIAAHLRWVMKYGHGASMHYADNDNWDTPVEIMVLRRDKEYKEIAEIFEEYAKNGHAIDEQWKNDFGGVLDKDLDHALEWFRKHFQSLWD